MHRARPSGQTDSFVILTIFSSPSTRRWFIGKDRFISPLGTNRKTSALWCFPNLPTDEIARGRD